MARKKNPRKPKGTRKTKPASVPTPAEDQSFQHVASQFAAQLDHSEKTRINQALAALKARILPRLRQWGVAKLVAEYSGYGDDGCINSLGYFDQQNQPVNMDLVRPASDPEIQNLLYELLPDGFETGEGGQGDLTVDVETGTVTLEHGENYTETTSSTSQWEV
jgi:hypothetical protein